MRYFAFIILMFTSLIAKNITQKDCTNLKGSYIFSGGECIEYVEFKGEKRDKLVVIVHGAWKEGVDTLARYKPFAETINIDTDVTTIAVALPGYSNSSTNKLSALKGHNVPKYYSVKREYIDFLSTLLKSLKDRYRAKELTVIAHSAGAMAIATILGYKPNLINNALLAGGRYSGNSNLMFANNFIDKIPKSTKIILVYGTKDSISKPDLTKEFYKLAKPKGLNVELIEVKEHKHLDLDMSDPAVEAIENVLDNK